MLQWANSAMISVCVNRPTNYTTDSDTWKGRGYAIVYILFIMSYQLRWVMLRADGVYVSDWRI